jgi:hypothetical protein
MLLYCLLFRTILIGRLDHVEQVGTRCSGHRGSVSVHMHGVCLERVAISLVYQTLGHDIVASRQLQGSAAAETIKSRCMLTPKAPIPYLYTLCAR